MPLEVKKQFKETSQALVRRFTTRIRQSGILKRVREARHRKRPKGDLAKKRAALRREELKGVYHKLKKMGKKEPTLYR